MTWMVVMIAQLVMTTPHEDSEFAFNVRGEGTTDGDYWSANVNITIPACGSVDCFANMGESCGNNNNNNNNQLLKNLTNMDDNTKRMLFVLFIVFIIGYLLKK